MLFEAQSMNPLSIKVQKLAMPFIQKNMDSFLIALLTVEARPDKVFYRIKWLLVGILWRSRDEFEHFLIEQVNLSNSSEYLKEFWEFFQEVKRKGYGGVEFTFKVMSVEHIERYRE